MPTIAKKKHGNPEAILQGKVKKMLLQRLPDDIEWTASMVGLNLGMKNRMKAKGIGVRRGFPDFMWLLPDGRTVYVELKTPTGTLSDDQKRFRDRAKPHGIWALCRSVGDVERALTFWGIRLRPDPFDPATL